MIFYFLIMKYNLTNETYLPEMIKNFPGAPKMSLWNIISVSIFYNLIPLIISLILYFPIVYGLKKLIDNKNPRLIFTGFTLTLTTPIFALIMSNWKHNEYYQPTAELIAWTLCFAISIGFYFIVNKRVEKNVETLKKIDSND